MHRIAVGRLGLHPFVEVLEQIRHALEAADIAVLLLEAQDALHADRRRLDRGIDVPVDEAIGIALDLLRRTEVGAVDGDPEILALARVAGGLGFSPDATAAARAPIEALFRRSPPERLVGLLGVLNVLASDQAALPLATAVGMSPLPDHDRSRLDRVLDHIHTRYDEPIALGTLADIAALSPSGLQRLFHRHTGTNVSAYVTRLRVGQAWALLSGGERPIARIAGDVGYDSLANSTASSRR